MNIFVLHTDAKLAAEMMCDKHVPKMVLETAQLLCSIYPNGKAPYRRTHYNHPCAKWARQYSENYWWLLQHGHHLAMEYERRYHKMHKSYKVISWCIDHWHQLELSRKAPKDIEFVQCMPEQYKIPNDPVQAYRNYYIGEKARFAKWKYTDPPDWWPIW